jgi:hypothetical protein
MTSTYPSPHSLNTPNVTNAAVTIATNNPQRLGLFVFNPSATVTIWVCPSNQAPTVGGAGCVAVQPSQGVMFGPPNQPPFTNGMNAIASIAGTNPVAVWEFTS